MPFDEQQISRGGKPESELHLHTVFEQLSAESRHSDSDRVRIRNGRITDIRRCRQVIMYSIGFRTFDTIRNLPYLAVSERSIE